MCCLDVKNIKHNTFETCFGLLVFWFLLGGLKTLVFEVSLSGGLEREVQVDVDLARLKFYGVSFEPRFYAPAIFDRLVYLYSSTLPSTVHTCRYKL